MKKIILLACLSMLTLSACDISEPDGKWSPIKLTKNPLEVPAEGGTVKTSVKNYSSLWLIGLMRDGKRISVEGTNDQGQRDIFNIKSEYLSAHSEGQNVTITVAPSSDDMAHKYVIEVEYGDAFSTITVNQLK
jgi:hypothetical protein